MISQLFLFTQFSSLFDICLHKKEKCIHHDDTHTKTATPFKIHSESQHFLLYKQTSKKNSMDLEIKW